MCHSPENQFSTSFRSEFIVFQNGRKVVIRDVTKPPNVTKSAVLCMILGVRKTIVVLCGAATPVSLRSRIQNGSEARPTCWGSWTNSGQPTPAPEKQEIIRDCCTTTDVLFCFSVQYHHSEQWTLFLHETRYVQRDSGQCAHKWTQMNETWASCTWGAAHKNRSRIKKLQTIMACFSGAVKRSPSF